VGEFIYTMKNVRKAHGDKVILDDVTMAFFPGAKIGVVGPNGAGKSSILKIMAGLDQPSNGEAFLDPGATVGILLQEPPLGAYGGTGRNHAFHPAFRSFSCMIHSPVTLVGG